MNKAHLTAMSRKCISSPMKWLIDNGVCESTYKILDYGCGKGKDVEVLTQLGYDIIGYDSYYAPNTISNDMNNCYDLITCIFVLNVIDSEDVRNNVINHIHQLLKPNGVAYIAVRSHKNELKGFTKRCTYQGYHPPSLPLIHKGNGYEMYRMIK